MAYRQLVGSLAFDKDLDNIDHWCREHGGYKDTLLSPGPSETYEVIFRSVAVRAADGRHFSLYSEYMSRFTDTAAEVASAARAYFEKETHRENTSSPH